MAADRVNGLRRVRDEHYEGMKKNSKGKAESTIEFLLNRWLELVFYRAIDINQTIH